MNTRLLKLLCAAVAAALVVVPAALAQDTTVTEANEATAFYVACDTAGVMNVTGTALTGYDVYYQLFNAPNATGTAVTSLRQLSVSGAFQVSEQLPYNAGQTLAVGSTGSARVIMASENNVDNIDFEFVVNDFNDGCAAPQFAGVTSGDAGTTTTTSTTDGVIGFSRSIRSPNGGYLNANLLPESEVVVGARPSDTFRSDNPGLLFAECDEYPLALPGIIYDTDRVVVFWSWFTRTPEQMDQHLAAAQYVVSVNTAILNNVSRSAVTNPSDSVNQWVFYTAELGNLMPGHYEIAYDLTWTTPVNDGYDDYGPGTANVRESGNCNFDVLLNPSGTFIAHNGAFFPTEYPVHDITPGF